MPTIIDEALCVRHWDFSETSQTVSLFTRNHGMLRGLAKGSKRERGRFSGGIDLLTRGQVVALVKPGRELSTLTDWDLLQSFRAIRERLDANRAAFYMAELVCRMILDSDPHPRVFDALVEALGRLSTPSAIVRSLVRFQWVLLEESGHRPQLRSPEETAGSRRAGSGEGVDDVVAFDPRGGGVVATGATRLSSTTSITPAVPTWPVRRATLDYLEQVAASLDGRDQDVASEEEEFVEDELRGPEGDAGDSGESLALRLELQAAADESARRAARLLAGCIREVLGVEPITLAAVFGTIPALRR